MKTRVRHVAMAFAAVLALVGVAGGVQGIQHYQQNNEIEKAAERADFWRGIAGTSSTSGNTIEKQLAEDLKQALGEPDPSSTQLPPEAASFRANPNNNPYAGISEALGGYNPFQGDVCSECGSLKPEVRENLLKIKQGNVEQVVAEETPAAPGGYTLTPFGASVPMTAGTLLVLGGTYLLVPYYRERRKEQAVEKQVRNAYGDCLDELDLIERALNGTTPVTEQDRKALEELRSSSERMRSRMRLLALNGETHDVSPGIQTLKQRVDDLGTSVDLRHGAYKELNPEIGS